MTEKSVSKNELAKGAALEGSALIAFSFVMIAVCVEHANCRIRFGNTTKKHLDDYRIEMKYLESRSEITQIGASLPASITRIWREGAKHKGAVCK